MFSMDGWKTVINWMWKEYTWKVYERFFYKESKICVNSMICQIIRILSSPPYWVKKHSLRASERGQLINVVINVTVKNWIFLGKKCSPPPLQTQS